MVALFFISIILMGVICMKAKALKQAKIFYIQFDTRQIFEENQEGEQYEYVVRPLTFDFNALGELQELGYDNPYVALEGLQNMRLKAIKALVYSGLVAGQLAMDEDTPLELSVHRVGQILGSLMTHEKETFNKIFEVIGEAIKDFFPDDVEDKKTDEGKATEENPKN